MNKRHKTNSIILPMLATFLTMSAPITVAASCTHEKPVVTISSNSNHTFLNKNGERIIKGSASEFFNTNRSGIFNPIDSSDRFYHILRKDNNQLINDVHDKNHKYKIKGNFDFLNFENLSAPYSYRIYSFRYDELVKNIPGVATRKKYYEHRNNPKAVYIVLYWTLKTNEAAPNFVSDIITPSAARLGIQFNPELKEEAPWPFVKGILANNNFWKNVIEPVVLIFDKE